MRVELTAAIEYAGRDCPAGSVMDIPKHSADWLISIGAAKPAFTAKPKKGLTQ